MTRVNLTHPVRLSDQHLFAEWREIKRIPTQLQKRLERHSVMSTLAIIPKQFTLGTGHVTFFYDKMLFLSVRDDMLTAELHNRGFKLNTGDYSTFSEKLMTLPAEFRQCAYVLSKAELEVSNARLLEKIAMKPDWYRYFGKVRGMDFFEGMLQT